MTATIDYTDTYFNLVEFVTAHPEQTPRHQLYYDGTTSCGFTDQFAPAVGLTFDQQTHQLVDGHCGNCGAKVDTDGE